MNKYHSFVDDLDEDIPFGNEYSDCGGHDMATILIEKEWLRKNQFTDKPEAWRKIQELWEYKEVAGSKDEHPLDNCSKELTSSKEFMLGVIKFDSRNIRYASNKLKRDEELLLAAIKENPLYYQEIPEELITNKKLFYETAKDRFLDLLHSDEDFCQYDYFTAYWMKDYWWEYDFAAFCNDKDIANEIFELINESPDYYIDFFEFLGPMLNNDKNFLHSIYRQMGTHISRNHKVSLDHLEQYTLELSDEAIEGHLSGIKEYMKNNFKYEKEIKQLTEEESKLFEETLKDLPDKPFKNLYHKNWELEKRAVAWKIIKKKKI